MASIPTIGELKNRVEFQTLTQTTDAQFRKSSVWATDFTLWGKVKANPGLFYSRGDNVEPLISHTITVRYRSDVVRSQRLISDGQEFKIIRLLRLEEGKKRFLMIYCEQLDDIT